MVAKKWTDEHTAVLAEHRNKTSAEIGAMLGVSGTCVRVARRRLGLERDAELLARYGARNTPSNSQTRSLRYAPEGWEIEHGHPCLVCSNYPPKPDDFTSPCTRCDARYEWCAAQNQM